ncbi:something about silencing, SAS, complex subunit 4-domain-containing protein [Hypoxylon crocopeplum]|nr:something about silencing, SAS, complex subunit 4-domain-containing protein [Hypoxylon crocopeplum]
MATSSRRPEAPQRSQKTYQRHLQIEAAHDYHAQVIATQVKTRTQNILQQSSPPRMKRPLDPIANNCDPSKHKRSRIAVEIVARSVPPIAPTSSPKSITVKSQLPTITTTNEPTGASSTHKPKPKPQPPPSPAPTSTGTAAVQQRVSKTATAAEPSLKKHKEKAINGIKHELDRLQPNAADTSSVTARPGRKLRSQEAIRFKSELSAYFPDYDEVIGNDPKEKHILNLDTPIVLVDTNPLPSTSLQPPIPTSDTDTVLDPIQQLHFPTVRTYGDNLYFDLHDSQCINFPVLEATFHGTDIEDPLPDAYFESAHKKAERLEKSIRNTEKGRAQHEKNQIIRLLNELQGCDWLRTMGVSGVTDSRKKTFFPARDHFIKGCQAILEKFQMWNREEKKRKLMRDRALVEEAEESEEEKEADEDDDEQLEEKEEEGADEDEEMGDVEVDDDNSDAISDGDPPDYSDVDASARQLHAEALARAKYTASSSKRSRGEPPPKSPKPFVTKEFTSFFDKKHQRDAALSKGRRRGRTVIAWGHPLPEMEPSEFYLPEEYRDSETLRAYERQKRRERRQRQQ